LIFVWAKRQFGFDPEEKLHLIIVPSFSPDVQTARIDRRKFSVNDVSYFEN